MKVGFIGLGHMGGPMSRKRPSPPGTTCSCTTSAARRAAGLEAASRHLGRDPEGHRGGPARVVITMLPAPGARRAGAARPRTACLSGLEPGSVWIDMSTSVPAVADRVRAIGAGHRHPRRPGRRPVHLAPRRARCRSSAGGDEAVLGRVRPLLEAMGDPERILYVGPHGAGYTVKLMLNLLWFSHLVATAEVLTIGNPGRRGPGHPAPLPAGQPGRRAPSSRATLLSVLERGDYDDSFALALACKDLGLAVDLAGAVGVPV